MNMKQIVAVTLAAAVPFLGWSKSKLTSITFGDTTLEPEDTISFMMDELPDEINGLEVLSEFAPDGIVVEWTGKKFVAPKAGKVKYSKSDESFYTTQDENPCGFKISINKKSGKVKGSFKVYCQKSERKLKSYSAKITGTLGGNIYVTIKKVGTYSASFE